MPGVYRPELVPGPGVWDPCPAPCSGDASFFICSCTSLWCSQTNSITFSQIVFFQWWEFIFFAYSVFGLAGLQRKDPLWSLCSTGSRIIKVSVNMSRACMSCVCVSMSVEEFPARSVVIETYTSWLARVCSVGRDRGETFVIENQQDCLQETFVYITRSHGGNSRCTCSSCGESGAQTAGSRKETMALCPDFIDVRRVLTEPPRPQEQLNETAYSLLLILHSRLHVTWLHLCNFRNPRCCVWQRRGTRQIRGE